MERMTPDGREILDPTPISIPVGFRAPESLEQKIARMVMIERLSQESAANGGETFEESLDFDTGEDIDPSTPWEILADSEARLLEDLKILNAAKKRIRRAKVSDPKGTKPSAPKAENKDVPPKEPPEAK